MTKPIRNGQPKPGRPVEDTTDFYDPIENTFTFEEDGS